MLAKNYTGAELEAVVTNAASFAMTRVNGVKDLSKQFTAKPQSKSTVEDFMKALDEVKPGFGLDQGKLDVYIRNEL